MVGSFFNRILIPSSSADPCSRACRVALLICCCLSVLVESSLGSKTRHFKWEVEYMYWSPDCVEGMVLGINGQFPGPTIHARAGDIVNVELKKKLSTEGVVIHWHGIRQQGTPWADGTASISQCVINPGETFVYRFKVERGKGMECRGFSTQYTKPLNPPAIAFSTKEGEAMLSEAIAEGTAFGSLKLFENFGMQRDLNFCGPASLCTVLNAFRVDPNRAWKGRNLRNKIIGFLETLVGGFCSTNVSELGGFCSMTLNLRELSGLWRWFEDPMIADSEIMEKVQKKGISFDRLAEFARKHVDIEAFKAQHSSLEQFTNCVIQTTSTEELYMILSYSRKTVNQTGDGHFSPMAAYHKGKDMLLILDVVRYKYPFHWLPRMMVWDAVNEIDKETGETRGFMMIRKKIS